MGSGGISRYGSIGRPESRSEIEAGPEVEGFVRATYALYKEAAVWVIGKQAAYIGDDVAEPLYGEACMIVEEGKRLKIRRGETIDVGYPAKEARPLDGTGMYLSALLNVTPLEELDIGWFPELDWIGYRIREGKMLVLGTAVEAKMVGRHGKGVILNWGDAEYLGLQAEGGFYGNWGAVEWMAHGARGGVHGSWGDIEYSMASRVSGGFEANWGLAISLAALATGGFQPNFGKSSIIGSMAQGGYQANFGRTKNMAYDAKGGLQINWKDVTEGMARDASGGVQVNCGNADRMGPHAKEGVQVNLGRIFGKKFGWKARGMRFRESRSDEGLQELNAGLLEKTGELDFLKDMRYPCEEGLERIKAFDFPAFERDVLALAGKIEEYVRERYGK